jgi:hypothetical protein
MGDIKRRSNDMTEIMNMKNAQLNLRKFFISNICLLLNMTLAEISVATNVSKSLASKYALGERNCDAFILIFRGKIYK